MRHPVVADGPWVSVAFRWLDSSEAGCVLSTGRQDRCKNRGSVVSSVRYTALTTNEWRGLTDTVRVRVNRSDGLLIITLAPDNGAPVSPADCVLITEDNTGLTHYDLHLSPAAMSPVDAKIPLFSPAGRVFCDFSFLPSWQASMLLIQAIPSIRALGGEARIQINEDALVLSGYLLAHLDYIRGTPADHKDKVYESCLRLMDMIPELREQLLIRLRQDAPSMPPETIARLLQSTSSAPPTKTYRTIINDLWQRPDSVPVRPAMVSLVAEIRRAWPDSDLTDLDHELRSRRHL